MSAPRPHHIAVGGQQHAPRAIRTKTRDQTGLAAFGVRHALRVEARVLQQAFRIANQPQIAVGADGRESDQTVEDLQRGGMRLHPIQPPVR